LYAVYILVLAFNALRIFGYIESVNAVFHELEGFMMDSSDTFIYLFIKQINLEKVKQWLESCSGEINNVDTK
jgi:hypothetical protein